MFGSRARSRRLERALSEAAPRNVWQLRAMPQEGRSRLLAYAWEILQGSRFEGCGDIEVDDEMRATVAAHCALLCHARPPGARPTRLRILLYPDYFFDPRHAGPSIRVGEVGAFGALALSWRDVLLGGLSPAYLNVVAHELAHVLDGLSGDIDGMPPLPDEASRSAWKRVLEDELDAHRLMTARRRAPLISAYAATDPGEFFAEAATYLLQAGAALREERPRLYALLADYFRLDPAAWILPEDDPSDARVAALEEGRSRFVIASYRETIAEHPDFADGHLDLGRWLVSAGRAEEGLAHYDEAVRLQPDDADLLHERGTLRLDAEDLEGALQDFSAALRHAPDWVEALCDRARSLRLMGAHEDARRDLDAAVRLDPDSDLACAERGYLHLDRGDADAALADLDRALALMPDAPEYFEARAEAQRLCGDEEAAARDEAEAARLGLGDS